MENDDANSFRGLKPVEQSTPITADIVPSLFVCDNIGQDDDGIRVEQRRNTDGTLYWCATTKVTHIFGMPVESDPLEGFGATEQQARERLAAELRRFNNSLWDE